MLDAEDSATERPPEGQLSANATTEDLTPPQTGMEQTAPDGWLGHPVIEQPGLGVTTTTVTTITQTGGEWSTGLFNVCGDMTTCLLGAAFPCCLDLSLAHQYGECLCLPLLPGSTLAMRVGIRERFKIRGSVCEDWLAVYCCYPLAVCQMIREVKRRLRSQMYQVSTTLQSS
ncbi:PLAC8-like protein 1 [Brienomyrus brachyistius]|uniref:PLAC8-like protein 1 n=1 Tax=Brienomyrus brachyistius TaxID=42636 RepID=UPI0020B2212B|nr:PLAC8-like protein 1 [Brienomyrus brachyistius]